MIREVIIPQDTHFTIELPQSYVNKKVEFIIFPVDEEEKETIYTKTNKPLIGGTLSHYSDKNKMDLEANAWEIHTMEKYQ